MTVINYGRTSTIFAESGDKVAMLGTRWKLPDGRVFVYAKSGAAIAIGSVCGHAVQVAKLSKDMVVTTARTTAQWDAGTYTIELTSTGPASSGDAITPNRFDDGYLWVNDVDGQGQLMQIKSHEAMGTTDSSPVFTIYDDQVLTAALTTASEAGAVKNIYDGVIQYAGTKDLGAIIGVNPLAISATAKYFWLQTWGLCPVLQANDTLVIGEPAVAVNTTGGATGLVGVAGAAHHPGTTKYGGVVGSLYPHIGITYTNGENAGYALVFLTIAP